MEYKVIDLPFCEQFNKRNNIDGIGVPELDRNNILDVIIMTSFIIANIMDITDRAYVPLMHVDNNL